MSKNDTVFVPETPVYGDEGRARWKVRAVIAAVLVAAGLLLAVALIFGRGGAPLAEDATMTGDGSEIGVLQDKLDDPAFWRSAPGPGPTDTGDKLDHPAFGRSAADPGATDTGDKLDHPDFGR